MKTFEDIYWLIYRVAKRLLWLLEFFLFLRLLLKFLNANPETLMVNWLYRCSDILVAPFGAIFPDFYWRAKIIETPTLVAMLGYAILILIIFQLIKKPALNID